MKHPALALAAILLSGPAAAKPYCGDLHNAFGPFDYRIAQAADKNIVEGAHFTEDVQNAVKGNTGPIGGDLDYTLRAFPNHPRALNTLILLATRARGKPIAGMHYPAECYFERAVRFQPDDSGAWAMYATFLYSIGKGEQAQPMLEKAVALDPDNPAINYNLGLAYARKKQYAQALPHAHKAYQQNFPLPGLRQLLQNAGQWSEPAPLAAKPAPPEAAPAPEPAPTKQP